LKRSLKGKAWQVGDQGRKPTLNGNSPHEASRDAISKTGISGILQNVQTSVRDEQDHLNDALQDLEALMAKAKDMVRLAAELNEKLTAISTSSSSSSSNNFSSLSPSPSPTPEPAQPEEATFIRSSLSQLGLHMPNAPVTQDMIKDERKWMEELAKELAGVLQGIPATTRPGLMKERGIIALDEVWGGWNRARGVALIPPSTFLQIIPLLPIYTSPGIHARTLASGLTVLHTPPYAPAAFASRLAGFLSLNGPQTTIDVAVEEGLSVSLVKEMVEAVERDGDIVRDDANAAILGGGGVGGSQLRWWVNVFERYVWDGQE
jgi:ESCRT-II complex subunit VPS36